MFAIPLLGAALLLLAYLWTRARYNRFEKFKHFPQYAPSFTWGHMKGLHQYIQRGKPDRHIDMVLTEIHEELGRPSCFVLDLRPISYPMAVITNHETAEQVSRATKVFPWSLPKSPTVGDLVHLTGSRSILTQANEDWKTMRKRFNPGFAPTHLMSFLPIILDKTWIFLDHLDSYVRTGEVFPLEKLTINLTFDIIGAVVMDTDFDAQHLDRERQGKFIQLYTALVGAYPNDEGQLPWWFKPGAEWKRYTLSRQIDQRLKAIVRDKYTQLRRDTSKASRSVLALSLQGVDVLTDDILQDTCDNLKTFLFAGHDTTSILLAWTMYELARTPHVLAELRAELDTLFGTDPDPAAVRERLLSADGEDLVKRMSYASAIIKEILRLHPPAGTARMSPPGSGFTLHTPQGDMPADGVVLYNCAYIIQRDPAVYGPTANEFRPERWLGDTDTSMDKSGDLAGDAEKEPQLPSGEQRKKVPASAWRPFERGPRNCIGQELANIEARVILAVVARRYDFVKMGMGEIARDETGEPKMSANGRYEVVSELYSTRQVTAKPVDGTMMKVKLTEKSSFQLN